MATKKIPPVHPGEILLEEFLQPMNITQETLATYLNISIKQINEIIQTRCATKTKRTQEN
jgi:addiction module HigA family antidote